MEIIFETERGRIKKERKQGKMLKTLRKRGKKKWNTKFKKSYQPKKKNIIMQKN